MTELGVHYFAIRHNITGKWFMRICDNTNEHGWTDDLFLADVWQPSDMGDPDLQALPHNSHWQAFTWAEYHYEMRNTPPLSEWLDLLANR